MTLSLLMNTACTLFGVRNEETPKYRVVDKSDYKEIRYYDSYIVAKTTVSGSYKEAQKTAFKRLAGYIFGDNIGNNKISMTAPVVQKEAEKISMTAPVTQQQTGDSWTMTFMMPSKYTIDRLPKPNNKNITIEEVPSKYFGVIEFSWYDSVSKNKEMAEALSKWLNNKSDFKIVSQPIFAGYNPPWTIPFLRKNEIMYQLVKLK
ncbi:heme-binding protein [Gammaproteobacteria bacterium]|nr:heme-binding protein [Gammaproteobacteria bacterium]